MHVAAFTGQEDVFRELVAKGANLNAAEPTHKGWTALHFCAQHRHPMIAKILCQNGADVSIRHRDGKTALDYALEFNHDDIAQIIQSTD